LEVRVSKLEVELNGVANIKMLLDDDSLTWKNGLRPRIEEQLDLMERYLLELGRAAAEGRPNAPWHEVRENPSKFPTNKEKHG
jgi:hypothetical protein